MAATTIGRFSWTNDTGSAAQPNGDGTLLNNAQLQLIFDAIDNLFTAAFTFGSTLRVEGFGSHVFSAGGTGTNQVQIRNTTAGTTNLCELDFGNDATAVAGALYCTSSTYTGGGDTPQDGILLRGARAGGLNFSASHASGQIRFFAAGISLGTFGPTSGANGNILTVFGGAFGTGSKQGSGFIIGHNSSGGGAAGWLSLIRKSGTADYLWSDAAGDLRISSGPPEEDGAPSDTSGTVVGLQSSSLASKTLLDGPEDPLFPGELGAERALEVLLRTPVRRFLYRNGRYAGSTFHGIIADWSPEFGMDVDADHPAGRSFNQVSAFGYTVQGIKALASRGASTERRLDALETRLARLEAAA